VFTNWYKTYSINKAHAILHTKYIPRVLCNTVEFHHFKLIKSHVLFAPVCIITQQKNMTWTTFYYAGAVWEGAPYNPNHTSSLRWLKLYVTCF